MFYIPSPVLAGLFLVSAVWAFWSRRRRAALCAIILALPPLWLVVGVENQWTRTVPAAQATQTFRLVHWNMCRGNLGWERACHRLVRQSADMYVVTEPTASGGVRRIVTELPASYTSVTASTMAIICRGSVSRGEWLEHTRQIRIFSCVWRCDKRDIRLFCVDVNADVAEWRNPSLQMLRAFIVSNKPDIVVGDFNAPRRSFALSPLPDGYRNAYDEAGTGWSYSWPVPCPVYAIDQCIIGPHILPTRYDLIGTTCSDHRMQVFVFAVR